MLQDQGAFPEARGKLEQALEMRRALYPKEQYPLGQPDLVESLGNLGFLLQSQGAFGEAEPLLEQGVDMQQGQVEILLAASSEAEAMNYLAQLPSICDVLISVCLRVPDSDEANYARVWRGKAAVARMLKRRHDELSRQAAANPVARQNVEMSRDVRGQLAKLLLATAEGHDRRERLARLQQLTAEKERLERHLAAGDSRVRPSSGPGTQPPYQARRVATRTHGRPRPGKLRSLRVGPADQGGEGNAPNTLLHRFRAVQRPAGAQVDLGPAAPIDEAVHTWRKAINERHASPAAEIIRRLAWEPLARQFAPETTTVVLALDGRLTAVPWAALPGQKPGTVLLEEYALANVPHAPFLLDRLTAPPPPTYDRGILLAVGGVDYDQSPRPVEDEQTKLELLAARSPRPPAAGATAGSSCPARSPS